MENEGGENSYLSKQIKMSFSQAYGYTGVSVPSLRGGENGGNNTSVIVLTVAVVVLILMVIGCVMYTTLSPCSTTTTSLPQTIAASRIFKNQHQQKSPQRKKARMMHAPAASTSSAVHHPAAAGFSSAAATVSDPLPSAPLMASHEMPDIDPTLSHYTSSAAGIGGGSETNYATTEVGGSASNDYMDHSYTMDPGMMSPSSSSDIKSLNTFMPSMNDGTTTGNGPVDPSTGLPLFTTGKLIRSQLLGGHGAGSFLRQQQDPLSGYSRLGKNMCGAQNARRDLAVRRAQFNEARLADPSGDPVLFQTSEFAYF